jgi:hypothetical protein
MVYNSVISYTYFIRDLVVFRTLHYTYITMLIIYSLRLLGVIWTITFYFFFFFRQSWYSRRGPLYHSVTF